jgi:outer membrane protein TolC
VLTAITTALGLIPMAAGVAVDFLKFKLIIGSSSAQWWGPMAVAVIFGLSFATVLTLVMVPTLYSIYDDFRGLPGKIRSLFRRPTAGEAAAAAGVLLLVLPVPSEALTLEDAVRAAERENIELKLARERVVEQSTVVGQAWASLSPRASIDAAYVINNQEIVADFGDFGGIFDQLGPLLPPTFEPPDAGDPIIIQRKAFWQGNFNASMRLFSGTAAPGLAGAYKIRDAAQADMRRIEQQIRAGTTASYYGLLTAQQRVSVAEQGLVLAEAQRTLAERQVEAGLADRRAKVQADLAVSRAMRDIDAAQEGLVTAEEAFRIATGLEPDVLVMPEPVEVPTDVESALVDAQIYRPDLEANELRAEAAVFERTGRYMDFLPVVDANFVYSYTENTGFNNQNWTWRLVFQGTWTLWDGGFSSVERAAAASRVRQARLQEALASQQAERDVRVAFEAYRRASTAYVSVDNELALARENLELAERTYSAGSATWLELEQAKLQLQSTELVALQERMNRDLAAVDLLVATGRL